MKRVPRSLQPILWSKRVSKLDLQADRDYIIHQVLRYGTLGQIHWLLKTYTDKEARRVFLTHPLKIYSPSAFNFIARFILKLKRAKFDENKYLASSSRNSAR